MKVSRLTEVYKIVLSAMFLGLSIILPFITMNNPSLGNMFCLMHFPVLLCGFICGWKYGLTIGLVAPILRFVIAGMPPIYPTALAMSAELGAYGAISGIMYNVLPKKKLFVYISLIISIIIGKLVWGITMFGLLGFTFSKFGISAFFVQGFINAVPGLILQIILIPIIIILYEHLTKRNHNYKI